MQKPRHTQPQIIWCKYLGPIMWNNGEIEGDINHRPLVICDNKLPLEFKRKFYHVTIWHVMYGTEFWAVNKPTRE